MLGIAAFPAFPTLIYQRVRGAPLRSLSVPERSRLARGFGWPAEPMMARLARRTGPGRTRTVPGWPDLISGSVLPEPRFGCRAHRRRLILQPQPLEPAKSVMARNIPDTWQRGAAKTFSKPALFHP
jgi:hypothetical protein